MNDYWLSPQGYDIPVPLMEGEQVLWSPAASADYLPAPIETSWLTNLWQPWDDFGQNLWGTGGQAVEYASQKLPELLWERGLREVGLLPKQSVVREGAGVTVVHTQAPQAGGAPAQPVQKIIPGQLPFYAPGAAPKAAVLSGSVMLVVGIVLFILLRK